MQLPDNVWIEVWHQARPISVRRQKRLFDEITNHCDPYSSYFAELVKEYIAFETSRIKSAKMQSTHEKLSTFYSKEEIVHLEAGARLVREDFNCELKILTTTISGAYKSISVQISQKATLSGEYFDRIILEKKVEDLFYPFLKRDIKYS